MRALLLLVSLLGVFPNAYQALRIPLPNAILVGGEPVGFPTPPHRERRAEKDSVNGSCSPHEYRPRRSQHCCNRCLAGYRVLTDCTGNGQSTKCAPCESGTYTEFPNNSKRCEACSYCMSQYGQITLSECTTTKDTECGCPAGQFKEYSGEDFICKECTTCHNGTELLKCHDDKDTICDCFRNFFFDRSERSCRPCAECQGPDCKGHCPNPAPSRKTEETNGVLLIVLGVMSAGAVAMMGGCIIYTYYTRKHPSSSDSEGTSAQTSLCVRHEENEKNNLLDLPGYAKDNPYILQPFTRQTTDGTLPLPDITNGTAPPCLNTPKALYAIIESIPISRWREFVRHLGLSNYTIESSEQDYKLHFRDAQYAMLQVWIAQDGCPTSKRDQLFNVLQEINLGGCIEKIEKHL